MSGIAVLLTQLGTPDAPTTPDVRAYLREFLSDPWVVDMPRPLWLPLLHGVILRTRPARSAALYRQIWRPDGVSPLLHYTRTQNQAVAATLPAGVGCTFAMRYGRPALTAALHEIIAARVERLLVFPLYPQYAAATTGSTLSVVMDAMSAHRFQPALRVAAPFYRRRSYIQALATRVQEALTACRETEADTPHILFSFHGLPQRHVDQGDPYAAQCQETARLLAEELNLPREHWHLAFQSRFGRERWLSPATTTLLARLPAEGVRSLLVVCPGFVADCLETLEEINVQGRALFFRAGGKAFHFVPCLNDHPAWIAALSALVREELAGWVEEGSPATTDERPGAAGSHG